MINRRMFIRGLVAGVVLLCWFAFVQAAGAQGAGMVEGTVINGTTGKPLAGAPVSLQQFENMNLTQTHTGQTDEQGRFRFEGLLVKDGVIYLARVEHAGVVYPSEMVKLTAAQPSGRASITVYDLSSDPSGIVIERAHLIIRITPQEVAVDEMIVPSNTGSAAYAGASPGTAKTPTLRFFLPAGASNVTFEDDPQGERFVAIEGGVADTRPVLPGKAVDQIVFGYTLPAPNGRWTLEHRFAYPVRALNVLVADTGWQVTSDEVALAGRMGSEGSAFLNYKGQDLPANHTLRLNFTPQPAGSGMAGGLTATGAGRAGAQEVMFLITAILSVLLLAALLTYPLWRGLLPGGENSIP